MATANDILQAAADLATVASDRADSASQIIYNVANGGVNTIVNTDNGEVNTVAKAIKDITDAIESASLAPQIEPLTASAGVLEYNLTTMNTDGMALYVEGSREFDFTVVDSNTFRLPSEVPDGTALWAVKREIYTPGQQEEVIDADFLEGKDSTQFLRSDQETTITSDMNFTADAVFGDSATAGSVRMDFDGTDKGRIVPSDGIDWDFNDEFGHQSGRWFFDNAPTVDGGNEIYHQGFDGAGSGLDADFVRGLDPDLYARTDSSNTFTGVTIIGGDNTTANSMRINFNGTNYEMVPSDGVDWNYADGFGYQGGWFFDNKPLINGELPVIEGEVANVPNVFTAQSTTTTNIDVAAASSFVVDNSSAVTLSIINEDTNGATTITVLVEGSAGVDWSTNNTINWTDNTEPTQGATWTLYVLTYVPTRGWYGSLGGRA